MSKAPKDSAQDPAQDPTKDRADGPAKDRAEGSTKDRAEGSTKDRAESSAKGRAESSTKDRADGPAKGRAESSTKGRAKGSTKGRGPNSSSGSKSSDSEPSASGMSKRAERRAKAASPQAKHRRRRRRRLVISGVVVTFFVVFGWIGVIVLLQMLSSGNEKSFREETAAVFDSLHADQVDEVYDQASPELHQRTTRARFRAVVAEMKTNLGEYQELSNIQVKRRISGPGGPTVQVDCVLLFSEGRVTGRVSFHETRDGVWRLLGISLGMPRPLSFVDDAVDTLEPDPEAPDFDAGPPAPVPASSEVMAQVERILEQTRQREFGAIYDAAARSLRAGISRERFIQSLTQRERALGRLLDQTALIEATQNRARDRARVALRVRFSSGESEIRMQFRFLDGAWGLTVYKAAIPGPEVPPVSAAAGL